MGADLFVTNGSAPFTMSTATVQFILFIWMAVMVALVVLATVRVAQSNAIVRDINESNDRILEELQRMETSNTDYFIDWDNDE